MDSAAGLEAMAFRGVFVTRGMQVSVPAGGLHISIGEDGAPSAKLTELHLGLNMSVLWFEIAIKHLLDAEAAGIAVTNAHAADDEQALGNALEVQAIAGMQAIVASCGAVDAYYAILKDHVVIPAEEVKAWRENGTPRFAQIAEVIRRAFHQSADGAARTRELLQQNFGFRDRAIHPPAGAARPIMYEAIERGVEWRFAEFRFEHAKLVVGLNLSMVVQTLRLKPRAPSERLPEYCKSIDSLLRPIVARWDEKYGRLIPDASS